MSTKNNILYILFIAFIIRFILLFINNYWFILPQGEGDAIGFERGAYELSISNYDIDIWFYLSSGARLFKLFCSFIYVLIDRQPFVLGLIMVFLGTMVVKKVYVASLLLWNNQKLAINVAWFAALFPQLMLHSALILREIPFNLFLMLSIIAFIKYWKYANNVQLYWFIFYAIMATLFHTGAIFVFLGLLLFKLTKTNNNKYLKKSFSQRYLMPFIIIGVIIIINSSGLGLNKFGGALDNMSSQFMKMENYEARGNSAYPNWMTLSGGVNDIWKVPVRYITFLFSPLIPFMVKSVGHLIGLIDAFIYLFLFYRIHKNRKIIKNNSAAKGVLIISLTLVLVFSLGTTNVGTAIRHRAKIAPLFLILFLPKNSTFNNKPDYHL